MGISEDHFQGTRENPFQREQEEWVLLETSRHVVTLGRDPSIATGTVSLGRTTQHTTVQFYYETASSSPLDRTRGGLHITWVPGASSWTDSYSDREKTPEERFEDGIAWAATVAEAHGAPRAVIDAITTKRPKR